MNHHTPPRVRKPAALALALLAALAAPHPARAEDSAEQACARLGRGVNLLGWDPIWNDRSASRFKAHHFQRIKEAGFQHVRLNLHPLRDGKPDSDGKLQARFLETLDWAIDEALRNRLTVILDFHDDLAISPDPAAKQKEFLAAWDAIATHCKDRPAAVFFEILNEPAPKFTHESWHDYWRAALAVIRKSNPRRTVILGPAQWNGVGELDNLRLPDDDRNLIATVHYYNPFPFTHQGTPWTGQKDKTGVTWSGTDAERAAVEADLAKVAAWSKLHKRPVYIGEFGAYEKGDLTSRVAWTSHVARQFEKHGFSWAAWQFADNFAVYDLAADHWNEPILKALVP